MSEAALSANAITILVRFVMMKLLCVLCKAMNSPYMFNRGPTATADLEKVLVLFVTALH